MKQLQRLTSLCIKSPKQQHSIDYATDNKGLPGVYMYQYHRAVKMGRREREREKQGGEGRGGEEKGGQEQDATATHSPTVQDTYLHQVIYSGKQLGIN